MTDAEFKAELKALAAAADKAVEIYDEVGKDAKTGIVQKTLTERRERIGYRLSEALDKLDKDFGLVPEREGEDEDEGEGEDDPEA